MKYDAVIIGSGVGGYPAAAYLADRGLKVAVVEEHHLGGECTNYGCVPSKALYSIAESLRALEKTGATVDYRWSSIVDWVKGIVKDAREGVKHLLEARDVSIFQGKGVLRSGRRVEVRSENEVRELEAESILVAVGTDPADIPTARFDGEGVVSNREALYFNEKPESVLIVGGGVIGVELANIYASFKSEVVVVELLEHILPFTDRDVALALRTHLQHLGVRVLEKTSVVKVEKTNGVYLAELTNGEKLKVDKVVVAVGRKPKTAGMGLEDAGVELDSKGFVRVNQYMETAARGIYASGDCVGGPLLAHKAILESLVAAKRIASEEAFTLDYKLVPITIFTGLEVASVGYTEKELQNMGVKYVKVRVPLAYLSSVRIKGYKNAFVKVLYDESFERVYGVHIVAPNASEVVSSYIPLYAGVLKPRDLRRIPYPHLTVSESLRDLAEYILGEPVHLIKR
ncbi:MAG: dihydrolipoyl dehydrogenase [Desulfurococcaceae archaeon]